MFVHGIPFRYIPQHFPELNAACAQSNRTEEQIEDARKLIEQFGFEPVHFLRPSHLYPLSQCMAACLQFGDTLLFFDSLPFPRLQLSPNEWAVRKIDMRQSAVVLSRNTNAKEWFQRHMPETPFFF